MTEESGARVHGYGGARLTDRLDLGGCCLEMNWERDRRVITNTDDSSLVGSAFLEWFSFETGCVNIHAAKAAVRKNNINMISAESGAPLCISISKRPPEAREAIDTGAGGKAKIIGCDGCSG